MSDPRQSTPQNGLFHPILHIDQNVSDESIIFTHCKYLNSNNLPCRKGKVRPPPSTGLFYSIAHSITQSNSKNICTQQGTLTQSIAIYTKYYMYSITILMLINHSLISHIHTCRPINAGIDTRILISYLF